MKLLGRADWIMLKYSDLFDICIGKSTDLNKLQQTIEENGINYIARTEQNNGVTAKVLPKSSTTAYKGGCITIPMVGNAMKSSYQEEEFCVSQNIAILRPKNFSMNEKRAAFFNIFIRSDIFRFNYGRTLSLNRLEMLTIPIPYTQDQKIDFGFIDSYMNKISEDSGLGSGISHLKDSLSKNRLDLTLSKWRKFKYSDLFTIARGMGPRKKDVEEHPGDTPFLTSIEKNNGLTGKTSFMPTHPANVITVNRNGSVAKAFYQDKAFCTTEDVHVFMPKFTLNKYRAAFLCPLIEKEKYRYNYGRKWGLGRMRISEIMLPATANGDPDWQYIEDYIKSLPYSVAI